MRRVSIIAAVTVAALLPLTATAAPISPVAAAAALPAGRYALEKNHAKLLWAVDHMGFSDYYGRFNAFDATMTLDPKAPAKSALTVTIDMASVATDIAELDATLKSDRWFDVAKFPTATFTSTRVTPAGGSRAKVAGMLTLHGVTKPMTLDVTLHGAGLNAISKAETIGFDATATIKRADYGVATFIPAVADTVKLIVSAEFHLVK